MNIFVTDPAPTLCAQVLPDKHVVKMPLETCQMLAIVCSDKWGFGYGVLHKKDGTPYNTEKGAFRNHPCTVWVKESLANTWWLLAHGFELCNEYRHRYGKTHSCEKSIQEAGNLIPLTMDRPKSSTRAMPDEYKYDKRIENFNAYKYSNSSKPLATSHLLRHPTSNTDWTRM